MSETGPRPVRRGYAIASLVLGILSLPTIGLLLIGAMLSVILGVIAVVKASREPEEYGGKGLAIAGMILAGISILFMPIVIGIGAGIAIPTLLRKRVSGNERAAIADVREAIASEARYQKVNAGYFDRLECLAAPEECIPGFRGPSMIPGRLLSSAPQGGYIRTFHAGPQPESAPPGASASSLMAFAYVAIPERPGTTGVRSFCGDATGRVCYTAAGVVPGLALGVCPEDCTRLH